MCIVPTPARTSCSASTVPNAPQPTSRRKRYGGHFAHCPSFESCLDDISRRFLTHKQNFGVGRKGSDLSRGFDSIQSGKSDVQQNQFWLEIPSLLNCFHAICHFTDDLQLRPALYGGSEEVPEGLVILCHENPD